MLKILSAVLVLSCLPAACTTEQADTPEVSTAVTEVHHAMCGHAIDGIGACGNYIQINGEYVKLVHPDLGPMQFCDYQEAGVDIRVAGEMKEGEFVAESWELVK